MALSSSHPSLAATSFSFSLVVVFCHCQYKNKPGKKLVGIYCVIKPIYILYFKRTSALYSVLHHCLYCCFWFLVSGVWFRCLPRLRDIGRFDMQIYFFVVQQLECIRSLMVSVILQLFQHDSYDIASKFPITPGILVLLD